jgi:ParB family chromosome partitioning protein
MSRRVVVRICSAPRRETERRTGHLVERLVQEKLAAAALAIEQQEGWSWSLAREGSVRNYGDDRENLVLPAPEGEFSAEELQRLDEL